MHTDWKPLPGSSGPEHIFSIGDVHGNHHSLAAALDLAVNLAKDSWAQTHFISLGDLNDRGPYSLKCIDLILGLDSSGLFNKVTYLPGNHELFMLHAIAGDFIDMRLWLKNGGTSVIDELEAELSIGTLGNPEDVCRELQKRLPEEFFSAMRANTHVRSGDLIFVHAGISPFISQEIFLGNHNLREAPWAWIRNEFLEHDGWWDYLGNQVVVHGHSTVETDGGCPGYLKRSRRIEEFRTGAAYSPDYVMTDPGDCDAVEKYRRINLDTGCGKYTDALVVGEFLNDQYRLHLVVPNS